MTFGGLGSLGRLGTLGAGGGAVNDPLPTITIGGWSAPEDALLGAVLGTLSIHPATGNWLDPITYSFVGDDDGDRVAIDGDAIERGATALDFADHPTLTFTIQADNGIDAPITRAFSQPVTAVLNHRISAAGIYRVSSTGDYRVYA